MKAEIDLRTKIATLDGTPQEIAAAVLQMGSGKTPIPGAEVSEKVMARLFRPEEDEIIIRMKKEGEAWKVIGKALNRSASSVRGRFALLKRTDKSDDSDKPESEIKEPTKPPRKPKPASRINLGINRHTYSDEDDVQIKKLYDSGHNDKQIASALGVSVSAVAQRIFKMRKDGKLKERPPVKDSKRGRKPGKSSKSIHQKSTVSFTDKERNDIKELYKNGDTSPVIIGQMIGRNSIEVLAEMRNLGLTD